MYVVNVFMDDLPPKGAGKHNVDHSRDSGTLWHTVFSTILYNKSNQLRHVHVCLTCANIHLHTYKVLIGLLVKTIKLLYPSSLKALVGNCVLSSFLCGRLYSSA